jgi:hypothetical protein
MFRILYEITNLSNTRLIHCIVLLGKQIGALLLIEQMCYLLLANKTEILDQNVD